MLAIMIACSFRVIVFSLVLAAPLFAGSRGVNLTFLDATTGERSRASLRLAELLEKDMRVLYLEPELASAFPWNELDLKLNVVKSGNIGINFDRLLNTKDESKIEALFSSGKVHDGLVVLFHDEKNKVARLKLYSLDGKEVLLLRLPLEGKDSAMANSLMKNHRRGALMAIGAAVRWNP